MTPMVTPATPSPSERNQPLEDEELEAWRFTGPAHDASGGGRLLHLGLSASLSKVFAAARTCPIAFWGSGDQCWRVWGREVFKDLALHCNCSIAGSPWRVD